MQPRTAPLDLADRLALGVIDDEAAHWVRRGFAAWVRSGGAVPLERCLGLPKTRFQSKLRTRDHWLGYAAMLLDKGSTWATAVALADELETFVSRGPWRVWQALEGPPADASELRTALFFATKANDGKTLSERHLARVIGHVFKVN